MIKMKQRMKGEAGKSKAGREEEEVFIELPKEQSEKNGQDNHANPIQQTGSNICRSSFLPRFMSACTHVFF